MVFDAAICVGLAGLALLPVRGGEIPVGPRLWLGLVLAVALAWRRRHPVPVMTAVAVVAFVQVLTSPLRGPVPQDVAVLIAMYGVVKYGERMRDAYLAAGVVAVGIAIEVVVSSSRFWYLLSPGYLGVCGGVWLAGYTVRNRRLYVRTLEERAATLEREREHLAHIAVVEERAAIARELHDIVAHGLAVMIVQAAGGSYAFDRAPERARASLATIASTGREALEDMHRLVTVLRGTDDGPDARRRVGVAELPALVGGARDAGLSVDADIAVPEVLPATVELTVYRVVQEGLTNVLRHSGPRARVSLSVSYVDSTVHIDIADDGSQAPAGPQPSGSAPGHGLIGMRERVELHGGTFAAGPRLDRGWQLTARIPCAS